MVGAVKRAELHQLDLSDIHKIWTVNILQLDNVRDSGT